MKKTLLLFLSFAIVLTTSAQTTKLYVTETGTGNSHTGTSFRSAYNPNEMLTAIYSGNLSGDIEVYFAEGDYYFDCKLWNPPAAIQSISLYGGFCLSDCRWSKESRDLVAHETRFHAQSTHMVWMESIGYQNSNGAHPCVIDGITLVSDGMVNFAAMALVSGDFIVTRCKFVDYQTSDLLVWLETGGKTTTFINCLFANNKAANLMALCSNVNMVNITVADNIFTNELFNNRYSTYNHTIWNSIFFRNTYLPNSFAIDAYSSIFESSESWINDIDGNLYTDPVFTYNNIVPYTCNIYDSPAINAGDVSCFQYLNIDYVDFDAGNKDRYWDVARTTVDIGAYQHGYDDGYYNYNYDYDAFDLPRVRQKEYKSSIDAFGVVWANDKTIFVDNTIPEKVSLNVYSVTGQLACSVRLGDGLNTIQTNLVNGIYIAKIISDADCCYTTKTLLLK